MKKIVCVVLMVCILFSVSFVLAESTEGYEKALMLVKERIGSTDAFDDFEGFSSSDESGVYYSFYWSDEDEGGMGATVSEDGVITEYYRDYPENKKAPISEMITYDMAMKRGTELFKALNPTCEIEVYECYPEYDGFSLEFSRTQNGIPVDNGGYIQLDTKGEHITSMYYSYDPSAEFETGSVIPFDEAVKSFKQKLGFELKYVSHYEEGDLVIKPVYSPLYKQDTYISAITGEVITVGESIVEDGEFFMSNGYAAEESLKDEFSPAEQTELSDIERSIDERDALKIIKDNKILNLPKAAFEDYSVSTYDIDDETRGYYFGFTWDEMLSARIRMNGQTGEILSFSKYGGEEGKPVFSSDDAEKTAKDALLSLAGKKSGDYKLAENHNTAVPYEKEQQKISQFYFVRYVNGIPFYDNAADITVSLADNSVTNYNLSYSDEDFPALDNVIDVDKAADLYIENAGFEPLYVRDSEKYRLVYALGNNFEEIDAVTGSYSGEKKPVLYSDISGHYCERIVTTLLEQGIGFEGEELKPDVPVLQKEFAALLEECVRYTGRLIVGDDYDYEFLYKHQLDKIITEKGERNPDGNVTRIEAAKYMSHAMGYGDIGGLDIFRPMFNDTEEAGFASILCGLKIMNGDGCGNFNPDGILTRAQALIMIYNYLNI